MSGVFSQWQPRYAERRIATFPVGKDKKPAIKNWNKIGLKGSEQLAAKFSDYNAIGFPLGPSSDVTIIDVDVKDPALLDDAQARYGGSPFIVETGGGYHAYYKYGGERRHIRPCGPEVPIDVLGGGYAVAAPSVAAKGCYEIIYGTLADLESLPPLRVMLDELREPIPTGKIPHAFGERAVLKLMYAALIRAAERWRPLTMTEFEQRQLKALRDELDRAHAERTAPGVNANVTASPTRLSSKNRT